MVLVFSFLLLFSSAATLPHSSSLKQAENQAIYYISQINRGQKVAENLWALSVLGSSNPKTKTFIEKAIRENYPESNILQPFKEFSPDHKTQIKKVALSYGSPDLLVAYLLSEGNPTKEKAFLNKYLSLHSLPDQNLHYEKIIEVIRKGEKITADLLPANNYYFLQSLILLNPNGSKLISKEYLNKLANNWYINFKKEGLEASLFHAAYFRTLFVLNKYSEIEDLYHKLINDQFFPLSLTKLHLYRFLDYSMYRLGYFNRNLQIARNVTLPLAIYLNQKELKLRINLATGLNLYGLGKIHEAEKIYQEVLPEVKEQKMEISLSSLLNNLAITYYQLGKYDKYLDLQFKALTIAKEKDNYSHRFKILNNLFIYYSKFGNSAMALTYLIKAQELAKNKGNSLDIGKIYTYLGSYYKNFNSNINKAHLFYSKAEEILEPKNNLRSFIFLLRKQANIYETQKSFSKALENYDHIITLTKKQNNPGYLDALVSKAAIYLKAGNMFMAEYLINKFKKHDFSLLNFARLIKAKTVEANYLHQTGETDKALAILMPAIDQVVERARNSADLQTGFWNVEDEYLNAFELAVSIFIEGDRPEKAVELLDRLKTINDASLYQSPLVRASVLNEKELTRYKRLTKKLDDVRKKFLTVSDDQKFAVQQMINRLKVEKDKLDEKVTTRADAPSLSVREVQNRLSAYELVLHITELKDKYYVARIYRSKVSIEIIPLDTNLRSLLEQSARQVASHETDLNKLYSITKVLGLRDIPDRIEKVTVIPDSYLYRIPLAILPLEKPVHGYSYGDANYLIEKYKTRYLTSLNGFKAPKQSNHHYKMNFVGYGISQFNDYKKQNLLPLPFAEAEVNTIADRLTDLSGVRTFVNEASTKETFKRTAPDTRILHLATHSEVSERNPLFSTFYMSRTSTGADSAYHDQIFAYELFELKLNNEMIMLNSCESGSGSYLQGSGIMGISRALQYAGANSLVLNLWPVNDMLAADFAVYFYSRLSEGKSKAAAMRATKLYFLENKNASPHFWGPYMLIGNTEPVINPHKELDLIVAGTFSLYFLLMVGLVFFKKLKSYEIWKGSQRR